MITVAGFNTAIDRSFRIDALHPGAVGRAAAERAYPGGKGLHVAQAIAALGEPVQLVGLVDAEHRDWIEARMRERGVAFLPVQIDSALRTCVALHEADGRTTEILGPGPRLGADAGAALLDAWRRCTADSAWVIFAGSLPEGLPAGTYAELIAEARAQGRRCLLDASGEALRLAVPAQPYLVKPNRDEAGAWRGTPVDDLAAAAEAVRALHAQGVAVPVVSMGAQGALSLDGDGVWHAAAPAVSARNPVGSGDCLLAGLAVGLGRGLPIGEALQLGVACGAANAMHEESGYFDRSSVERLRPETRLRLLR